MSYVDNPRWQAPEIFENKYYDEVCIRLPSPFSFLLAFSSNFQRVDIYGYGVVIWEMLARAEPWREMSFMSEIESAVKEGQRLKIPKFAPRAFASLIKQCWDGDPNGRPSWKTILEVIVKYVFLKTAKRTKREGTTVRILILISFQTQTFSYPSRAQLYGTQ